MSLAEQHRRDLFNGLEEVIGTTKANHLMELLPQTPAAQLVTRDDMHANTLALKGEMAELRGELRGEMAELRTELKGEMAELRTEISELRADMIERFATAKTETNRLIVGGMMANAIAVVAALTS